MAEQKVNVPFKFWTNFRLRYRVIALVICAAGLVLNFIESGNIIGSLSLFNVQTNILCTVMFTVLVIRDRKGKENPRGRIYYFFKGMSIVAVLALLLLYHLLLKSEGMYHGDISNIIMHTVAPILIAVDFALFDRKGGYKRFYPFIWVVVPVFYYVYSFFYVSIGGTYIAKAAGAMPYYFMDVNSIGLLGVILWGLGIIAGFIVLGFIVYAVDHWFAEVRDN